jgi:hypothetical protein
VISIAAKNKPTATRPRVSCLRPAAPACHWRCSTERCSSRLSCDRTEAALPAPRVRVRLP